jgi:hypothetical protein
VSSSGSASSRTRSADTAERGADVDCLASAAMLAIPMSWGRIAEEEGLICGVPLQSPLIEAA